MKRPTRSGVEFSSEDSMDDSDNSMNSSIEASNNTNDKYRSNKINQLREQMNQLFLSNPELVGSIKFAKLEDQKLNANYLLSNIPDPLSGDIHDHHHDSKKLDYISGEDSPAEIGEDNTKTKNTGKYWEAISREMTREHKGSKIPTIKRINNVLNIFRATIEKPEQKYDILDIKPTPRASSLGGADGRNAKDKKKLLEAQAKSKEDDGAIPKPPKTKNEPVEDKGLVYYSFKKKMQMKLKEKQEKMKHQQKLAGELVVAAEAEETQDASTKKTEKTKADYSDILPKGDLRQPSDVTAKGLNKAPSSNNESKQSIIRPKSEKRTGMSVVDRLTKDIFHTAKVVSEEELLQGKEFKFKRARDLYLEKKRFGDTDAFESGAVKKLKNFKREFNEKVANNKAALFDSVKFTKDKKARKYNLFTPDFEKASGITEAERDMIFASHDFTKITDFGDNPDTQGLAKINKILEGNILLFWKSAKEAAL